MIARFVVFYTRQIRCAVALRPLDIGFVVHVPCPEPVVTVYSLHPIISVFVKFKIYFKIRAHLEMGSPNLSLS
jgi:hypothetical protein